MSNINYAHLFSGINAPEYAVQRLGLPMKCLYTSEINEAAIAVQRKNFPDIQCLGNLSTVVDGNPPKVDLAIAGSSCQSFSFNGKGEGLEGSSGIIKEFWRYLKVHQPRAFLWENVSAVTKKTQGETFQKIVNAFTGDFLLEGRGDAQCRVFPDGSGYTGPASSEGYHIAWVVLNAKNTSPQNRERVYMVGFKDLSCLDIYSQLMEAKKHSLPSFLKDQDDDLGLNKASLFAPETDFVNYLEEPEKPVFLSRKALAMIHDRNEGTSDTYRQILAWVAKEMSEDPELKTPIHPYGNIIDSTFKACFEETTRRLPSSKNYKLPRQRLTTPCLTVGDSGATGKGRGASKKLALFYVDNEGYFRCRRLTITETERLQGFADEWTAVEGLSEGKRRQLVGNSMAVSSVGSMMKAICKLWEQH